MAPLTNLSRLRRGGAWVPAVTVYSDEEKRVVDIKKTVDHVLALQEHGAQGVVINGTTGEGHLLRQEDKLALVKGVGKLKRQGRIKKNFVLITGTGTKNILDAKDIIEAARENGFHGILALPDPVDNRKYFFYQQLAIACQGEESKNDLGLILYNHPKLDKHYNVPLTDLPELMKRHRTVVGIKDSFGDPQLLQEWHDVTRDSGLDALVAVGEDSLVLHGLTLGCRAAIAGTANTKAGLSALTRLFEAHRRGESARAQKAQADLTLEANRLLAHPQGFRAAARENRLSLVRVPRRR